MAANDPIKKRGPVELRVCEACGYEGGFHAIFSPCGTLSDGELKMDLKCPGCGQVYELGIVVAREQELRRP